MPDRRSLLLALPALALTRTSEAQVPAGRGGRPVAAAPDFSRGARLERVAAFPDRQITGITVSGGNRVFVCLPRWTVDVPVSVAELKDGALRAYPDEAWNAYRNAAPGEPGRRFVCVQSVVAHGDDLWVLDPAAPGQDGPVRDGPKLVRVDLRTDRVAQVIAVPPTVAIPGSYMNDLRVSPDGRWGYVTDSGTPGALIVVDLRAGRARRVLHDHPSVRFEEGVVPEVDGRPLRRPDGRPPQFAADGIALSPDGATLYWQALTGRTLYSVPTGVLRDLNAPAQRLTAAVRRVGTTHVADGLWTDAGGRFFVTNPETNAVEVADSPGAPLRVIARDEGLRWPDTLGQGPDGALWVTASHIQDSPWFRPEARTTPSSVWRIVAA